MLFCFLERTTERHLFAVWDARPPLQVLKCLQASVNHLERSTLPFSRKQVNQSKLKLRRGRPHQSSTASFSIHWHVILKWPQKPKRGTRAADTVQHLPCGCQVTATGIGILRHWEAGTGMTCAQWHHMAPSNSYRTRIMEYPLVMTNVAIENDHRNSGFSH